MPVDEIHKIERGLAGGGSTGTGAGDALGAPSSDVFLHAQVIVINQLTEAYFSLLDGPGGAALIQKLGRIERLFTIATMPAAPLLHSHDTYADAW